MAPPELLAGPTDVHLPLASLSAAGSLLAAEQCASARSPRPTPLAELFATVSAAFQAERARGVAINSTHQPPESVARLDAAVRRAVHAYVAEGHADWRRLAVFNDEHYVRHLVGEDENFEMMLICWKRGQASRVHNHGSSHCWLNVLSGGVEELRFTAGDVPVAQQPAVEPRLPGVIQSLAPCPQLKAAGSGRVRPGGTCYINDSMGLHSVRCDDAACDEEGEEGAVSLHIYAPPIRRVRLYEPEQDRVTVRAPGFATIRGLAEQDAVHLSLMSASL